jgi:hypothetical protein
VTRPILVVGAMRSGTTLLNAILNNHPRLGFTYQHLMFWRAFYRRYDPLDERQVRRLVVDMRAMLLANDSPCSDADVEAILGRLAPFLDLSYAQVYEALMEVLLRRPVERFGETYPGRCEEIPFFLEAYLKGQIIHIHRDPRDVFTSEKKRLTQRAPAFVERHEYLVNLEYWRLGARAARLAERLLPAGQFARVRFLDLVMDPERTARDLCAFLELEYEAGMLDMARFEDDQGRPWEANSSFTTGVRHIDPGTMGRWRSYMTAAEVAYVERWLFEEMVDLGFLQKSRPEVEAEARRHEASCRELESALAAQLEALREGSFRPFVPREIQDAISAALPNFRERPRSILIGGSGPQSWLAAQAARSLGVGVRAYAAAGDTRGMWDRVPLVPIEEACHLEHDLFVAGAPGLEAPRTALEVSAMGPSTGLAQITCTVPPALFTRRPELLTQRAFEGRPDGWLAGGAGATMEVGPGGLRPEWNRVALVCGQDTAWLLQTLSPDALAGETLLLGAWVRASSPGVARVQLFDGVRTAVSPTHPGDGDWHYLGVSMRAGADADRIDAYLQVVPLPGGGSAEGGPRARGEFAEPSLRVVHPPALHGWREAAPFLISPRSGRPLRLTGCGHALIDGDEYSLEKGVVELTPRLPTRPRDPYSVSRRAGDTAPLLWKPWAEIAASLAREPLTAWLFGRPLVIRALGPVSAPLPSAVASRLPVGTLFEREGHLLLQTAEAVVELSSFEWHGGSPPFSAWPAMAAHLAVGPPFFLLGEPFPHPDMVTLCETLGTVATPPEGVDKRIARCAANVPWLRWLFAEMSPPIGRAACLDLGCGSGWLSAAMAMAGAGRVLATDIRCPDLGAFREIFPQAGEVALVRADMFEWCYAGGRFALIVLADNSAFAMTSRLDGPLVELLAGVRASLAPEGVCLLSYFTDFSTVPAACGFSNRPLAEVVDCIAASGLHVVKMMRLGSTLAFMLSRPEDAAVMDARCRRSSEAQRLTALGAYLRREGLPSARALRNMFLAVADLVSDIALAWHRSGRSRVGLVGSGILGYYVWRLMTVHFPHVPVGGFIVEAVGPPSALNVLTAEAADEAWGDDVLRVWLDTGHYAERALDRPARPAPRHDLSFAGSDAAPLPVDDDGFAFRYLSGDHDESAPPAIASYYLSGLLHHLQPTRPDEASEFEARFFAAFPAGFEGH